MNIKILIASVLGIGFFIALGAWLVHEPDDSLTDEKISWCYGVYHGTKPRDETWEFEDLVRESSDYAHIEKSFSFKKGKWFSGFVNKEKRAICYDKVYSMLGSLQKDKGELSKSVPYCFGYVSIAREDNYIPFFCPKACQKLKIDDCLSWCIQDFEQNLRSVPRKKGEADAEYKVNPAQFLECIHVIDSTI